jgi:hypothetical protein
MPTAVDAAALVAALSAAGGGHVAACEAVRAACDMSALPAEEEVTAYAHHDAGVALVRAGALAALAALLTAAEAEEHQQAVKAALNAMRAVRAPLAAAWPHAPWVTTADPFRSLSRRRRFSAPPTAAALGLA